MFKKILSGFLLLCCGAGFAALLPACGVFDDGKIKIVCSAYPQYDFVTRIVGERADRFSVRYLLDNGSEIHGYQNLMTVDDLAAVSLCDLFIYVGGESDEWVTEIIELSGKDDLKPLAIMSAVTAKEEETVDGMQPEEDHGHEEETVYDEHVWLSLKNAQKIVNAIASEICALDADGADEYRANAERCNAELADLDTRYGLAVEAAAPRNTLLFADRFPFRYLTDDYGLKYYAAFAGCSTQIETDIATLNFLINKVRELNLSAILQLETTARAPSGGNSLAETIKAESGNANLKILTINSIQSVSAADIANGASYAGMMEANLEILKQALA